MDLIFFVLLASIVTVVGRIIIDWRRVWRVLFLVSQDIFFLLNVFFWIYCYCYHPMNHIWLIMVLTMMGLTSGPLVRALSLDNVLVVLTTLLILFVAWGLEFRLDRNRINWWRFFVGNVHTNMSRFQRWSTNWNILVTKVLIYPPNFKISF